MNKKSKIIPFSILTMLLVVGSGVLSSCSTPSTSVEPTTTTSIPDVEVSSVTLSEAKVSLEETATKQLTATVLPVTATVKTVVWSSSDAKIATVSDAGLVTAIKAGKAIITAKAGTKTATCEVTVTAKIIAVASIALDHTAVSVEAGKTAALVATVLPANATDKSVTWTTSAAAFATVSKKGVVTGVAAGKATITAKAGAKTATCEVTVTPEIIAVASIALEPVTVSLEAGKTTTLVATVLPANATNKTVTWTTSAATFATVSDKGVVTGVAAGEATITAKAGEKTATCVVTVTPEIIAVASISLDHTAVSVEAGKTAALVATVLPANATDKSVTWTTSAAAFATVSDKGVVTGVAAGEATITAKAGEKTATSVVTVTPIPVVPYDWYDKADAGAKVYTVSTAAHLIEFGNIISGLDGRNVDTFAGKTVQLAKDIDISTVAEWRPIGGEVTFITTDHGPVYDKIDIAITPEKTFQGTLDGATHSISGLSVSKKDAKYGAFFVALLNATVKNINFTNINMALSDAASTDKGCDYASVVGIAENTKLTDINVSGKIQSTRVAGIAYVVTDGTKLTNCVSSVTLISKTKVYSGAPANKVSIISGGLVGQVKIAKAKTIADKAKLEIELFLNCEFNGTLTVDVSAVAPSWVWVGQLLGATSYPSPATNGYYTLVVNNFKANGKLIITDAEPLKSITNMPICFNGIDLKGAAVEVNTANDHHDVHNKLGRIHKDLGLSVK